MNVSSFDYICWHVYGC